MYTERLSGAKLHQERTDGQWSHELQLPSPHCNRAMEDLMNRIRTGLEYAFSNRTDVTSGLLDDIAQDAVIRVVDRLDSFRGESRFLTWANKVAVRAALTELRRRRWRDVSLDALEHADDMLVSMMKPPETAAVQGELMGILRDTIRTELTEKQRSALIAVGFRGMPLEEVARRLDMNRNSLYKLMHDARKRLKKALLDRGLSAREIIDAFD